jgi:antitoxin PrlF
MANIESKAKLTSKGQVTIPIAARKALDLQDGGKVEMFKDAAVHSDDAVVAAYLSFLERDLIANPGKLAPFVRPEGVDDLVAGVDLDDWLDAESKA